MWINLCFLVCKYEIHYHHTATAGTRQLLCSSFVAAIISPALCWSTRLLAWKLLVVYIHTRYPRRDCGEVNIPAELTHWIFLRKLILPHLKPKTQQLLSKGVSKTNVEFAFKWQSYYAYPKSCLISLEKKVVTPRFEIRSRVCYFVCN